MPGKKNKKKRKKVNTPEHEVNIGTASEPASEPASTPLGPDLLQTMVAEVNDWSSHISTRYARLAEYVDSLERSNENLENRVDRCLDMVKVNIFSKDSLLYVKKNEIIGLF